MKYMECMPEITAAPEPIAIRNPYFGDPCMRVFNPLIKYFEIDEYDGNGQKKLGKSIDKTIMDKNSRHGQAKHVPHA